MKADLDIIRQHIILSCTLFLRYGAVLTAVWAIGMFFNRLFLHMAVEMGMFSRLIGLIALTPVILLQMLIFVTLFVILRRGLPNLRLRRKVKSPSPEIVETSDGERSPGIFAGAMLAVLIPFYGYYAGWGLLGDTLRSYSQKFYATQMARVDFTKSERIVTALEIGQTGWVIVGVGIIWLIRYSAKTLYQKTGAGIWPMIVVACEATWALLGLYVISGWKDGFAAWLATVPSPQQLIEMIIPAASAAITSAATIPVDWPPAFELWPALVQLFWFALLPLIWFNLGAIVYGHDLNMVRGGTQRVAGKAMDRWRALPKPITDFIGHFWAGLIKRWHAVGNGLLLAASAGFALSVSVIVLWRFVDWLGNWAWVGLAELIGPQDMFTWQVLSVPLNSLFNAPGAPAGGLLVSPMQFCILAAGLDLAGRVQASGASEATAEAAEPA